MRAGILAAAAALLLLAGCATKEQPAEKVKAPRIEQRAEPEPKRELKTDGKYYKDDGPPAEDEVDWRTVPDATVAFAPIDGRYNRPYEVFGTRYVPFSDYQAYRKRGMASWYGRRYHGRQTSSGEVYDMYGMSAAHTVLPIPSFARVTRVDDGRSIVVRVNDRGPFLNNRIIDLSYTAARKLGVVESGTAEVIVEAILPPETVEVVDAPTPKPANESDPAPKREVAVEAAPQEGGQGTATSLSADAGSYLQLGAFSQKDNADNFASDLLLPATLTISIAEVRSSEGLHRVLIGPYPSRSAAEQDLDLLHAAGLEALLKVLE